MCHCHSHSLPYAACIVCTWTVQQRYQGRTTSSFPQCRSVVTLSLRENISAFAKSATTLPRGRNNSNSSRTAVATRAAPATGQRQSEQQVQCRQPSQKQLSPQGKKSTTASYMSVPTAVAARGGRTTRPAVRTGGPLY